MSYNFDGVNKIISISSQTTVSVRDLWSRYLDWYFSSDNSKYLPAFRTVGGDTIDSSAGTSIPIYSYLTNGWKIRPMESNHTLNINDGILLVDGGGDPFTSTIGSFMIRINYQQPVQAITVATGGSSTSPEDVANAVWNTDISLIETGKAGNILNLTLNKIKLAVNLLLSK